MPEEQPTPTTEETAAEQAQPATPEETPKPEAKTDETDYRAAYVGLQRTVNKLHARNEDLQRQNAEIADVLRSVKETTSLVAKQSLGEDQVKALEEREKVSAERAAAYRAAQALEKSVTTTIALADRLMASAGLSQEDRNAVYRAAQGTTNIDEWAETVHALATERISKHIEAKAKEAEGKIAAKSSAEIKAEAEALAQRKLKESGVDKIDAAKGTAPTRLADRIRDLDANSPEFKQFYADVLAGRVK